MIQWDAFVVDRRPVGTMKRKEVLLSVGSQNFVL